MKNLTFVAALFAVGCIEIEKDTGSETTDTSTTEETVVDPSFSVAWGDSSVALTISDAGEGASYYWGIAENNDCTDCWTAEDCHMGYDLTTDENISYCHPVSATGADLTYGASYDGVVEGESTLFYQDTFSTSVTYVLDDRSSADAPCWTWGADTTYYNGYEKACTAM